jgi:uncharacterized protein YjbI with pentapeptide repeats
MKDAADEPTKPTPAEPQFRKVSDEELQHILMDHARWVEAHDKNDRGHLRADLSETDLQETLLAMAQLQEADLRGADLQRAVLIRAQLQGARLNEARLQGADLRLAKLQGAELNGAQLQGADLSRTEMQGARLAAAQLEGANLDGAKLQGTLLSGANFREAVLRDANFEQLAVSNDGEPRQDCSADLTDADFCNADLSNAQLKTVAGLRAEMLARAVLTNAKLPDDVARFDQLKHVKEISRNTSSVFLSLLAVSLYSWLTIAITTDVALITGTGSPPLPIINTNIPLSGFYIGVPLILIAVYFYFHLYLQRLWDDLASLPAVFPDGVALDRKAYPWLLNGLVRAHFQKLGRAQRPLSRLENFFSILLAWWVVPLTLLALWLRFLPLHDWWVTTLHVALIAGAAWFGVYSYRLAVQTLRGEVTATEEEKRGQEPPPWRAARSLYPTLRIRKWRTICHYLPGGVQAAWAGGAIVLVLSAGTAIVPSENLLTMLGYETYPELAGHEISMKPAASRGQEETAELDIAKVRGADLEGRDLRGADASGAFLMKANLANAELDHAGLVATDLSFANLRNADLSGADLSGAKLSGADLSGVDFSGADLTAAPWFTGALYPTQAQLNEACGDESTQLPQGLTIRMCSVSAPLP